jgi:hypothetical protein
VPRRGSEDGCPPAAFGSLTGSIVMAGPARVCPLTSDGCGDGRYWPWLVGRGNLAPAPAEVARDGALTEAVSRVPRRDGRCRRRRHAARDRRRRGGGVGGRLSRPGCDARPAPAPAPDLPEQGELPAHLRPGGRLRRTAGRVPGAGRHDRRARVRAVPRRRLGRPGVRRPRPVRRLQLRLHRVPPAPRLRRRVPVGEPRVCLVPAVARRAGDAGDAADGQPTPGDLVPGGGGLRHRRPDRAPGNPLGRVPLQLEIKVISAGHGPG